MKLRGNSRRILFDELEDDSYELRTIPQNSIPNMIDIGANVGFISIYAKMLHPRMNIIAVEPHETTYQELKDKYIWNIKVVS